MLTELMNTEPVNYQNDVVRFEHTLTKTIDLLKHLDKTLAGLNGLLKRDMHGGRSEPDEIVRQNDSPATESTSGGYNPYIKGPGGKQKSDQDQKQVFSTTQGMIHLAENTIKVAESFGKLSGELQKVKTGPELMNSFNRGLNGVSQLMSMGSNGFGLADGVAAAGEVTDGIAGVVPTEVAFRPVSWAAAATLVVSGIVSAIEQEKAIKKRDAELDRNTEHSMQPFVMSEADAAGNLGQLHRLAHEKPKPWKLPSNPVDENVQKFGPGAYDLAFHGSKQAVTNPVNPKLPPLVYNAKEDETTVKKSYPDRTLGVQNRLNIAEWQLGISALNQEAVKTIADAIKHDQMYHTNALSEVDSAFQESFGNIVTTANENGAYSLTGRSYVNSGGAPDPGPNARGKVININMNKAMIENFTVKSNSENDGLIDFKQKVEEVLLEILNSANAIQ